MNHTIVHFEILGRNLPALANFYNKLFGWKVEKSLDTDEYWLYVVYDCATAHPQLLRVQDPFANLVVRARGGVIIDEGSISQVAEQETIED